VGYKFEASIGCISRPYLTVGEKKGRTKTVYSISVRVQPGKKRPLGDIY
jgi:hypothetical protein